MAATEPGSRSAQRSTAAADLVVPVRWASSAARGSATNETTSLSAGRRSRVMPAATIEESHRMGAPASSAARVRATTPGVKAISPGRSTCPQVWMSLTTTRATSSGNADRSASALMVANDCR
ncbi:Uncharacterised protein [Mycobacteroides abscessus subsp. abscessus]|nr:Uncharacterised protein [Mycobacteroides abscessus subsp. abscessus]SHR89297.1 Uncharacterised protein [Mycobacteroides abscessus subsp. abscessus]SHX03396.1 Uncharacterised protein [Mycobacteroides abscessus subsp. abscessus]SHX68338.1 Uncharacterised protein [Mycobacteroides abscessus subsp. abscessus]SHY16402.1 Uncharacterised protein [Mycobacteroides abscessus subsp. abscessus]